MKNYLYVFMLALLPLLLTGCEQDAAFKEYEYPAPVITEVYPTTGYVGAHVAVAGTDFGDQVEAVQVSFGGVQVENILSCQNEMIIVQVPEAALSGKVSVQVWKKTAESAQEFVVIPTPVVSSVRSDNVAGDLFAVAGDEVTVTGNAFGNDKTQVTANIRTTVAGKEKNYKAEVLEVSDNEITLRIPDYGMSGTLVLNVGGYELEGSALINPSASGDVTGLFLKNYTQPFERGDASDSEWGSPLYWLTTSGFGSALQVTAEQPDGLLVVQSGWGQGTKQDAQLYQLATLPQGNYTFTVTVAENTKSSGRYGVVFAVSRGSGTLPNLDGEASNANTNGVKQFTYTGEHPNLLTWVQVTANTISEPVTYTCSLTLEETTAVTIGFVSNMNGTNTVKFSDIRIERNTSTNE